MQKILVNSEELEAAKQNPLPALLELSLCKQQRDQAHNLILKLRLEIVLLNEQISSLNERLGSLEKTKDENQGQD